jgi:hypothetical protein
MRSFVVRAGNENIRESGSIRKYTVVLGDLGDFRILCIFLVFSVYPDKNHIFCTLDTPGRLS